jgi:hypothetical protein
MMKQGMVFGLVLPGACAVEHKIAAADPRTAYGFAASTADYARCQALLGEPRCVQNEFAARRPG